MAKQAAKQTYIIQIDAKQLAILTLALDHFDDSNEDAHDLLEMLAQLTRLPQADRDQLHSLHN